MWNCFQIWWIWPKPARQRESGRKFRIWWRWRAVSPGRRARFTQNQNENLPLPLCHTVHTRVVQEDGKFRCNPRVKGSHSNWKAWFAELYFCAKWMFSLHRFSMQPWEDSQAGVDLCCIPPPPLHLFCLFLKLNFAREDFWFVHTAAAKKFRSQGLHPNFPAALPATLFPKGDSDCQLVFPLATISVADKMSLDFTFFIHLWDGVDFGDINFKSPNK